MFQRIQTIFLLMLIISLVTLCWVPIWTKADLTTGNSYTMYAWHLEECNPSSTLVTLVYRPYVWIGIFAIISSLLTCHAVLQYHNRLRQLQLCACNSLILVAILGCIVYWAAKADAQFLTAAKGHYQAGFIAIVAAIVSNLLANQFIKKDEQLVREADRIR